MDRSMTQKRGRRNKKTLKNKDLYKKGGYKKIFEPVIFVYHRNGYYISTASGKQAHRKTTK